ncbi:MAG: NUDIX domain-containing protein [Burkholderia sp.]
MSASIVNQRAGLERHFTASGLVMNLRRELLLLHHATLDVWLYPGGHVEPTETPDQAVLREIREETGIAATLLGAIDSGLVDREADVTVLQRPYQVLCEYIDDKRGPHYHLDLIYLCCTAECACPAARENERARFFRHEEMAGLRMFLNFRQLVDHLYRDEAAWRLVDHEVTA